MERITNICAFLTRTSFSTLELTFEGDEIAIVTLNSPKDYNCISRALSNDMSLCLSQLSKSNKVKVICIRSALPKVFCAGADIKTFKNAEHEDFIIDDIFSNFERAFLSCKKPIIVACNKLALGGGFEFALMCDIILADDKCQFGFPEITLGVFPGIGGSLISKTIGK